MTRQLTALDVLATPLEKLRAVTPAQASCFERLGLRTALDLLFFFPRDYQDLSDIRSLAQLTSGSFQSAVGTVVDMEVHASAGRRNVLGVLIEDGSGHLRCVWFNQPFMQKRFRIGQHVLVAGKAVYKGGAWQMAHPSVQWLDEEQRPRD
jgi:ATP-dependent DNA helicase RecG